MERNIIHLNITHFAAAVEQAAHRELRNRPVIVATLKSERTQIYDLSIEAFREGLRKGMTLKKALRRLPDAIVKTPRHDLYQRAMNAFVKQTLNYTPLVEPEDSRGHLFMDVSGTQPLFGEAQDIAAKVRQSCHEELKLKPVWAVARSKLLAKIGSRLVKPYGEIIIPENHEKQILQTLPLKLIPGIADLELKRLQQMDIFCAADLIEWELGQLEVCFGKNARSIYQKIRGIDPEPVLAVGTLAAEITEEIMLSPDTNDYQTIESSLFKIIEKSCLKLRKMELFCSTIELSISYSDGMQNSSSLKLKQASNNDLLVFNKFKNLLSRVFKRRTRLRFLQIKLKKLSPALIQKPLFSIKRIKNSQHNKLQNSLDKIRKLYGHDAIKFARQ